MEQKIKMVNNLFHEFQSSFENITDEEKRHLAEQILPWLEQQANNLGFAINGNATGEIPAELEQQDIQTIGDDLSSIIQAASLQDIQNLVNSVPHLKQIAENIEQVFWLGDINSDNILYINPAFQTVWGRTCESVYANSSILMDCVHPEDRVQVMVASPKLDHKPLNQIYRILRPDGSIRWVFTRTFLFHDAHGDTTRYFCIAQDITDQKQVELALRKTLDRTREQFNISHKMSLARKPEAVLKSLMTAHELRSAQRATLLFFDNPKAGPAHGIELTTSWLSSQSLAPWVNESTLYEEPALLELFQPRQAVVINNILSDHRLTPVLRELLLEGQIKTMAIFPLVASGSWLGCLVVYFKQETRFNNIELRHVKILIDQATITLFNLKLLEVEEESRQIAEHANEIKTEFLAMISHELRTPLTSIIGFTTTLLAKDVSWESEEQQDFIQTIQQEAGRLQELIDHLLDLSRLEAGMLPINKKPHFLQEIIDDALPQFYILTPGKTLTTHLPAYLPSIDVDAKRIAQVLVNLVRNSATYAPNGTEINISASARGKFVQVNVNDQGPGIPSAQYKNVFKAFIKRSERGERCYQRCRFGVGNL